MRLWSRVRFGLALLFMVSVLATMSLPVRAAEETAEKPAQPTNLVPYVPTPMEVVDEMLKMTDVGTSDVVYDLGCGDGRIVVEAVKKFGARCAVGVDINPQRLKEARELARKEGVENKVRFYRENVFKTDFSSATVVTMYLLPEYNAALAPRLTKLLRVGSRVVSHDFNSMPPSWKAVIAKDFTDSNGETHSLYFWKITDGMKRAAAEK